MLLLRICAPYISDAHGIPDLLRKLCAGLSDFSGFNGIKRICSGSRRQCGRTKSDYINRCFRESFYNDTRGAFWRLDLEDPWNRDSVLPVRSAWPVQQRICSNDKSEKVKKR